MSTTKERGRMAAAETFRRRYAAGVHKTHSRSHREIYAGADPVVSFILGLLPTRMATMQAEVAAGLGADTIRLWRYRGDPRLSSMRRALRGMGYDLAVVDFETPEVVR